MRVQYSISEGKGKFKKCHILSAAVEIKKWQFFISPAFLHAVGASECAAQHLSPWSNTKNYVCALHE